MGFDPLKVRTLTSLLEERRRELGPHDISDISVRSDDAKIENCLVNATETYAAFRPYPGWKGHLEI
jgi:hypothetical protein